MLEAILTPHVRAVSVVQAKPIEPKKPRVDQSPEAQAARATTAASKKQRRAEVEKRVRMLEAKRQAEIEVVHRKSGFTNFVRRVPGSFEGGKK